MNEIYINLINETIERFSLNDFYQFKNECIFCSECEDLLDEPEGEEYFQTDERCEVCKQLFPEIYRKCLVEYSNHERNLFNDRKEIVIFLEKLKEKLEKK